MTTPRRSQILIREVERHEVSLVLDNVAHIDDVAHILNEIKQWLLENIGDERPHHPIYEARTGWLDYFDGEWAWRRDWVTMANGKSQEIVKVWFFDQRKAVHFALRWKGN